MSLKTKIIGAIVASALACPPAFAVEGSDGMFYTSASEGFYASIRTQFRSGDKKGQNSAILQDAGSRFGVTGTSEMSHGLEGFYRYEMGVPNDGGADKVGASFKTRKAFVGLRGGFGEFRLGYHDVSDYDFVYSKTDTPNVGARATGHGIASTQAIHYKSPDFNGLQVGAAFQLDGGNEKDTADNPTYNNDLDQWVLAGHYEFSGFGLGASYGVKTDAHEKTDSTGMPEDGREDWNAWGVSGSYGQDNWNVGLFYSVANTDEQGYYNAGTMAMPDWVQHDEETDFSISGDVTIGKTKVLVTHDVRETSKGMDQSATVFEIEYKLNSQGKVWIGYVSQDDDTDPDKDDFVNIGLRHDL